MSGLILYDTSMVAFPQSEATGVARLLYVGATSEVSVVVTVRLCLQLIHHPRGEQRADYQRYPNTWVKR